MSMSPMPSSAKRSRASSTAFSTAWPAGAARTNSRQAHDRYWSLPRLAAMILLSCMLLPLRNHEYRERSELDDNREQDERNSRLLVKKSGCDAADEPAYAISGVIEAESQIALALWKNAGHHCFQQSVLGRVADSPQQHSKQRHIEAAEKDQGREERRQKDGK